MNHPQLPQEQALLDLLPPPSAQVAAAASARPTLAQVLAHYQQQPSGGSGAAGAGTAGAATGAKPQHGAAAAKGQHVQLQPPPKNPVVLANEIQYTLQQAEEAARREQAAKLEAAAEHTAGTARAGGQTFEAAAASLLERAGGRQPLTSDRQLLPPLPRQQAAAAASAEDAGLPWQGVAAAAGLDAGSGALRMLVGVISACCTEQAAQRRAAIRETWAKTVLEVRGCGGGWGWWRCCYEVPEALLWGALEQPLKPFPACLPPQHPGVDLRFFLAQPPTAAASAAWLPRIQARGCRDSMLALPAPGPAAHGRALRQQGTHTHLPPLPSPPLLPATGRGGGGRRHCCAAGGRQLQEPAQQDAAPAALRSGAPRRRAPSAGEGRACAQERGRQRGHGGRLSQASQHATPSARPACLPPLSCRLHPHPQDR